MGRPKLLNAEVVARVRVGTILRRLRQEQSLSLDKVCGFLGADVTRARLWGIEKGRLPYSGLLVQLGAIYSETPESIIEEATGQSSLGLLESFFLFSSEEGTSRKDIVMQLTSEEEELVRSYVAWIRYRQGMGVRVG